MAKVDLGEKRVCPECSSKFYDLTRRPAICPKCEHSFDPEALDPAAMPVAVKPLKPEMDDDEDTDAEVDEEDIDEEELEEENPDNVFESDLHAQSDIMNRDDINRIKAVCKQVEDTLEFVSMELDSIDKKSVTLDMFNEFNEDTKKRFVPISKGIDEMQKEIAIL